MPAMLQAPCSGCPQDHRRRAKGRSSGCIHGLRCGHSSPFGRRQQSCESKASSSEEPLEKSSEVAQCRYVDCLQDSTAAELIWPSVIIQECAPDLASLCSSRLDGLFARFQANVRCPRRNEKHVITESAIPHVHRTNLPGRSDWYSPIGLRHTGSPIEGDASSITKECPSHPRCR
jgi:hypothetical protein